VSAPQPPAGRLSETGRQIPFCHYRPHVETTTNEIAATAKTIIATGNAALDRIGKLGAKDVNFHQHFVALDDLNYQIGLGAGRLSLIEQTSTNAAVRDAATGASKQLSTWRGPGLPRGCLSGVEKLRRHPAAVER